jgi:penicillin-binding protein 1C
MKRTSKIPVIARRQRRREPRTPIWRIIFAVTSLVTTFLFFLILIPVVAGAVGYLYLTEQTEPWVDRIVENVVVAGVSFYADNVYEGEVPTPETIATSTERDFKTTQIYDRTGTVLLWEVLDPRGGNRQVVTLEQISPYLIDATIALEDKNFYVNPGVDLRGITRAAMNLVSTGAIQGGGSSITQQLVKLVAIDPEDRFEQDFDRKIKEIILAIELSNRYDKDTILEWYLNQINYGRLAYGAQAAAVEYFGKNASELTLAEAALLARLPNAPAYYDPYTNPEAALEGQQLALDRMLEEDMISRQQYQEALQEPVLENLVQSGIQASDFRAPHFTLYVVEQLEEKYGTDLLYRGGLKVITTLDYTLLQQQEAIAREHIGRMQSEEGIDVSNAAIVSINPRTGELLSMMGSLDFNNAEIDGQVNMALAPRQPGSSIKPYTYLTAFINGYTAASMIWDVRTVFDDSPNPPYVPENYERDYRGPVLMRDALQLSLNIPAVKTMQLVTKEAVIDTMHKMGINTLRPEEVGLALTLGGGDVTLLDHVYAFSVMANGGVMAGEPVSEAEARPGYRELNPVSILRVENSRGEIIYSYDQPQTREIISPQLAYLMQNIMSDNQARVPAFGEENPLTLPDRPVAAKTGTTNDFRDGWTMGFTPQYVTGVWTGNADYRVMAIDDPALGSAVAGPIWQRVMAFLHEGKPVEEFPVPQGMVAVQVCRVSGMLPTTYCPEVKTEIFIEGTQPTTPDTLFQPFRICGNSGQLATVYCPPDQVRTQVFMLIPPEAEDWARSSNIPRPPIEYDPSYGPVAGGPISISSPAPYGFVRGSVSIEGNAYIEGESQTITQIVTTQTETGTITSTVEVPIDPATVTSSFQLYRVQVGAGLDPASWVQIGPDHFEQKRGGLLEAWNTGGFADGIYTLQLLVLKADGSIERASSQVTLDNTRPTVELVYPYTDQTYELGGDSWLNLQAQASDNIALDSVEFYINGRYYEESSSALSVRWTAEAANLAPGESRTLEIYAVAVDSAGNRTQSDTIRVTVVGK